MPAYRRLPSGLWQATVRMPGGRRVTRTDPLKSVVKTWAEDAELDIRRGQWADPRDGRVTLEAWHERWSKARSVEVASTKRDDSQWRCHVKPRWGHVKLSEITSWDVEAWSSTMKKNGVGAHTRYGSLRLLKQMLHDAARHKLIPVDPSSAVELPRLPKHVDRVLTRDEYDRLRLEVDGRDRVIMDLMALAGLRWGEVAGLHSMRVDTMRRRLTVVETRRHDGSKKDRPKSEAGLRIVPLLDEQALDLSRHLSEQLVFPRLHYSNWRRRVFVPAVQRAKLDEPLPTPHDLRHSYGTWLADDGVPPHEIKELMGHGSLRSTERYLHATEARFERARASLMRHEPASPWGALSRHDATREA